MEKPQYHLLVCNSFRLSGATQGVCNKKGAVGLLQYLEGEIIDRSMNAMISSAGCLKACEHGPVLIVYPNAWWYGQVTEEKIDQILDGLEEGRPVEELLLA